MQRQHSYCENSGQSVSTVRSPVITCCIFQLATAAMLVIMIKWCLSLLISCVAGQYQPLISDQQQTLSSVAIPAACTLPLPPSPTPPSRPPSGDAACAAVTAACWSAACLCWQQLTIFVSRQYACATRVGGVLCHMSGRCCAAGS